MLHAQGSWGRGASMVDDVTILTKERISHLAIKPMREYDTQKHTQPVSVEPERQKSNKEAVSLFSYGIRCTS